MGTVMKEPMSCFANIGMKWIISGGYIQTSLIAKMPPEGDHDTVRLRLRLENSLGIDQLILLCLATCILILAIPLAKDGSSHKERASSHLHCWEKTQRSPSVNWGIVASAPLCRVPVTYQGDGSICPAVLAISH